MGNAVESKKNQVKLDFFKSSQMNGRKGNILSRFLLLQHSITDCCALYTWGEGDWD